MRCPKCGSECRETVDKPVWADQCAYFCEECQCWFTTWQQSHIEELECALNNLENSFNVIAGENNDLVEENERIRDGLKRLEWMNSFCPICDGHDPKIVSPLSLRNPDVNGHRPDCWLAALTKEGSDVR